MRDRITLENMLLLLKGTCEVYVHGTQEASNKKIHDVLYEGLDEILQMQFDVYNKMAECGFYEVSNISSQEIQKTYQKLKNKEN